jgi:serine protease Do
MSPRKTSGMIVPTIIMVMAVSGLWTGTARCQSQAVVSGGQSRQTTMPADELDQHFQNAKADVRHQNYRGAAHEIRTGAAYLEQEAGRAPTEIKARLMTSARELTQLAARLEIQGTVPEPELDAAFEHANQALATHFQHQAEVSWSQKAMTRLGQELQHAAEHLEQAWTWSGHKLQATTKTTVEEAKRLGGSMAVGAKAVASDIRKSLDAVQTEVRRLTQPAPPVNSTDDLPVRKTDATITAPPLDLSTAIIQVARDNMPAVVHIQVIERQEIPNPLLPLEQYPKLRRYFGLPKQMPKKFERELVGVGTGMLIDPHGHILTNNHVVAGATKIQVLLADGRQYNAKVVGTDPKTDLGVIQIAAEHPLPHVVFGDSDQVEVGQWVVAIGQPANLSQSVSQGIISAKHRTGITDPGAYEDFLQTDAAINPGNSGGPLLDLYGRVIGVNSAILSQSGGSEGIGFAIPSNMATHVAEALIAHGTVERGWMGINVQDLTPEAAKSAGLTIPEGALVVGVIKGGPADVAGVKQGDVILDYQGQPLPNAAMLRNDVANTASGQEATVSVWRHGEKTPLRIKIGNLDDAYKKMVAVIQKRLGAKIAPVTDQEVEQYGLPAPIGVVIKAVDATGPLGKAGFEVGDMILAVDGQPIVGVEDLINRIIDLPKHQTLTLRALDHRTGNNGDVQVTI